MLDIPHFSRDVSLRLSEVLNEIGVNEALILKKRRSYLLREIMGTIVYRLLERDTSTTFYYFGSKTEGSTTTALKSDTDVLYCDNTVNVIQDVNEWKPGKINLKMIKYDKTFPGYCLLQRFREDIPLPYQVIQTRSYIKDESGRILLKNSVQNNYPIPEAATRLGPSHACVETPGFSALDTVHAYRCKSWPTEAKHRLHGLVGKRWPTEQMLKYIANSGCILVPVGSKIGVDINLEWRISTCLAERCLVFALNITQIRCYILMKMILKTYINPQFEDVISSYMCKTVLFHCVELANFDIWQENNQLQCLTYCLIFLYICILEGNCPHYFIPGNNLMAGRIPEKIKPKLLDLLYNVIQSNGKALLEIKFDNLGTRLQEKLCSMEVKQLPIRNSNYWKDSGYLLVGTAFSLGRYHNKILSNVTRLKAQDVLSKLLKFTSELVCISRNYKGLDSVACSLLVSQINTCIGTVMASVDIGNDTTISSVAHEWFILGSNSDTSSSRLKFASALFCEGHCTDAVQVLDFIEDSFNRRRVENTCFCYPDKKGVPGKSLIRISKDLDSEDIRYCTAFCVRFLPSEINCVPMELKFEMFRSTKKDLTKRKIPDYWMDWAVVDSLSYLWYLRYKFCTRLHQTDDKLRALAFLRETIDSVQELGHRETALNLLGQCLEHENQPSNALHCYMQSLCVRKHNNAAKILICKLLAKIVRQMAC